MKTPSGMGGTGSSFAALQTRLAQGKGKASPASTKAFKNKTSWSKGAKKISKGNPTFAVSGATPGDLKKRGV